MKLIKEISSSLYYRGRKYSGINILKEETVHIFEILSNGSFVINGFTNKDIQKVLFLDEEFKSAKTRNKTTRLIRKMIAHGLVWKTPKSMKYHLTIKGRKIVGHILYFLKKSYPEALSNS